MNNNLNDFIIEGQFPAIITPKTQNIHFKDFLDLLNTNKDALKQALNSHGGLLFRDFPIENAKAFAEAIKALGLGSFVNYIGGDSPRDKVEEGVYTSTEAPPSFHIPLHQELSFIKHFPKNIYFYCEIPPIAAGETIIADARKVYQSFDPEFIQQFRQHELTYVSRYYYKSKLMQWVNQFQRSHKSWIEVFETEEKEDVEQKCKQNDFAWKWLKNDWLEIRQTRPAICHHPETHDLVWFNQLHLYDFNPKLLGLKRYVGAKLFYIRKNMRLHEIEFADGTRIPRRDIYHILETLHKNTVYFPWKKRDFLVLDNVLAMHGRAPFTGKRRILTALTS